MNRTEAIKKVWRLEKQKKLQESITLKCVLVITTLQLKMMYFISKTKH